MEFWEHVDQLVDALPHLDYFGLLGIGRDAEPLAIQDAYYAMLRRYHPDRHAGADPIRQQKLALLCARIGEAYRVLSSPPRRAEYTAGLASGHTRSRPGRRTTLTDSRDPRTDKGRTLLSGARELAARGNVAGARAKLELALQFEPESAALRRELDELEPLDRAGGTT